MKTGVWYYLNLSLAARQEKIALNDPLAHDVKKYGSIEAIPHGDLARYLVGSSQYPVNFFCVLRTLPQVFAPGTGC